MRRQLTVFADGLFRIVLSPKFMFGRKHPHLSPYIRFALHIPEYTKCHRVVISHDESNSLISSNYTQIRKFFFFTISNVVQAGLVSAELCLACVQSPPPL